MYNEVEYRKEYRKRNSKYLAAKSKKWREDNPERYKAQMKKYRVDGRYKLKRKVYMEKYNKDSYQKDIQGQRDRASAWRKANPDKIKLAQRNWTRSKIANDLNYRLLSLFRRRIYSAIKANSAKKAYKTIELLGCSVQEVREHLEKLFKEGMSWDNYGQHGWTIDHIKPCSLFDFTLPEEQKKCFHYTNLQPLWALENILKSNKFKQEDDMFRPL
jgi:hypothetical protein